MQETGNPAGHPVFLLHGTPGSRVGPLPRGRVLYELGVRLITFDRPGYGWSDRLRLAAGSRRRARRAGDRGRRWASTGSRSSAGREAARTRLPARPCCPSGSPGRAVLVSLAPWAAEGLDWFAGMADSNVREYTAAATAPEALTAHLVQAAAGSGPTRPATSTRSIPRCRRRTGGSWPTRASAPCSRRTSPRRCATPRRLDRRRARVLRAVGLRPGGHQGARACSGTARTTCSLRRRTPAGWPTRSPARSCPSGRTPPTSARSRWCPTYSRG